ncbi:MAG: SDR family NAD(P)-dependent oxidoreductase [Rhizobiaceae bacterium]
MVKQAPWKHVWITGGSSGLGEHTARLLAAEGCHVSISARSKDKLEAIASSSKNISAHVADVTDLSKTKKLVAELEKKFGPIDLCIFNAGVGFKETLNEFDAEIFRKTFDINVQGVVNAFDAILPRMIERKQGHISWVASVAGYGGLPGGVSYGASKAALIHMAETAKMGLDDKGIDFSVINPGFVRTAMTAPNKHPMPFLMEVEDAAEKIVKGLKAKKYEIAFPWQLVWVLKIVNHLPRWLYIKVMKRLA